MSDDEWEDLILKACDARPSPVRLATYRGKIWSSWAFPAALADANGMEYVVKSPCHGPDRARAIVTEQVVSALGRAVGAPVAIVRLVDLPQELLEANASLGHLEAGVCHGSRRLPNVGEATFAHVDQTENRPRFAALAALYGLTVAADHQFLYDLFPPYRVHSHDHGIFLPGRCFWTVETLNAALAAVVGCDPAIVMNCRLSVDEIRMAVERVAGVLPTDIAAAVAAPPDEWGIVQAERLTLAKFLDQRREKLLSQT